MRSLGDVDNERRLIEGAQAAIGSGDQVIAAGWFEPWSRQYMDASLGAGVGAGTGTGSLLLDGVFAAAGVAAAGSEAHKSGDMPAAVILAVSATKVYAFQGNVGIPTGDVGALWRSWSLSDLNVHAHKTLYVVSVTLEEHAEGGHTYHLVGSKVHLASSKAVMSALLDA